ncbi:GvpL/GvpF family gas vesicle protein [Streptomyces sp. 900105755]
MSTYVYGIIRASHSSLPKDTDGIGDPPRPVRVLRQGELAAIVSDAPEELRPKRRDLLAHQRVLDAAGAGGVVLPMRFGSVSPDDDTVTTVLAERAERFLERLGTLDGKAEYNVKANHNEEAVLRLVMADDDEIRSLAEANREAGGGSHEEKIRLGEMVAAAFQAREAADAELLQRALEPTAEAVSAGPQSTGWLANLSFLVDRGSAEQFLTAVDGLREEHPHLELRVHGPLPPYSFVDTPSSQQAEGGTAEAFGAATDQQKPTGWGQPRAHG